MNNKQSNNDATAAVVVAKELKTRENNIVVLPFDVRAKITPVSASLLEEVSSRIRDPIVPVVYLEDKGREEENPLDPEYRKAKADVEQRRTRASLDAMVLFGVELLDPLPDTSLWLARLKFLEKRGSIDLSDFDLEDPIDLDFVFKRFIAVSAEVLNMIANFSNLSEEALMNAEASFQGD